MQNKYKILTTLVTVFFILFLFLILRHYLTYSFIFLDDANGNVYCTLVKWKEIFRTNEFSLCFSPVLGRIFGAILPYKLDLHPSYFKSIYFSYIEAFIFIAFIFLFSKFISKKNNLEMPLYLLLSASAIFFFIQNQPLTVFIYDGFFRMIIPVILWLIFLFSAINNIKNDNNKISIIACLVVFLCSISNELTCLSLFTGLFILSVVKIIQLKKFPLNYITYLTVSILGILLLIKTNAFYRKSPDLMFDLTLINTVIGQFAEYLKDFVKYVFLKHIWAYLFLIFQIVFINIKLPQNTYKNRLLTLNISLLSGILLFFLSLIVIGKTHYIEGEYWLVHDDLHLMYSIMLCAFNLTFLNVIIRENLLEKYIISVFLLCISVFFIYKNILFYNSFLKSFIIPERIKYYTVEKMVRLADLKNKTAYLPDKYMEDTTMWPLFDSPEEQKTKRNNKNSRYIEYLNQFEKNQKINAEIIFTDENTVDKEFADNGGIITEEELHNIDFNKLTDKKFILNN